MMKKLMLLSIGMVVGFVVQAQILHPVKWSYAAKKTGAKEAVLLIKATIEEGWHIYSVKQPDGGPIKTSFTFSSSPAYALVGVVTEPKPLKEFNKTFSMDVFSFSRSVIFRQKMKLKAAKCTVSGNLHFMVCNDEKCLPPEDLSFTIPVK